MKHYIGDMWQRSATSLVFPVLEFKKMMWFSPFLLCALITVVKFDGDSSRLSLFHVSQSRC